MEGHMKGFHRRVPDHAGALVTAILALLMAWYGQMLWAAGVLIAACTCFYCTKRLEDQVKKANEQKSILDNQLIQSQKLVSIGELSAGIAHEINNPLAIMGQEVEWMRHLLSSSELHETKGMAELMESMQEIARQVERCREITHKLLDFARRNEPLIQCVDINKLIEDMARLVEKEAMLNDIKIVRDYLKDLPLIYTDPPLLRQVILNLLNNATYAIQRGGAITVTTRLTEDSRVELNIRDTGCGIPKEDLNKVFDPFFTTKPPGKGTGLGLSICHGIIEKLGGSISVSSEVGKGSEFSVRLPIKGKKGAI
jgi:two-component system NtrC family sensor kinase